MTPRRLLSISALALFSGLAAWEGSEAEVMPGTAASSASLQGSLGPHELRVKRVWSAGEQFFTNVEIADVDGDGLPEMVGAGPRFWHVIEKRWDDLELTRTRLPLVRPADDPESGWRLRLDVVQHDLDRQVEVVVSFAQRVAVWDVVRGTEEADFPVLGNPDAVRAEDVDGDGLPDLVTLDEAQLVVYDLATGQQKLHLPGRGGRRLLVGELDDDPAREILVASASGTTVTDALTGAVEWSSTESFAAPSAAHLPLATLGDLNFDGRDELVHYRNANGGRIVARDLYNRRELWSAPSPPGTLAIGSVDGDAAPEVVLAARDFRSVRDASGNERWARPTSDSPHLGALVGDGDGDGEPELVLWGSSVQSLLVLADGQGLDEVRMDRASSRGFRPLDVGDVDADGEDELLFAGNDRTFIVGAESLQTERSLATWRGGRGALVQADADPQVEICLDVRSVVRCLDGITLREQWSFPHTAPWGLILRRMELDGDPSREELLLIGTDLAGVYLRALTPGGTLLWTAPRAVNFGATHYVVDDVDADGELELVVSGGDGLEVRAVSGGAVEVTNETGIWESLGLQDVDRDGTREILVTTDGGLVYVFDPLTNRFLQDGLLPSYPFEDLFSPQIGAARSLLALSESERLHVLDRGLSTLSSAFVGRSSLPNQDHLVRDLGDSGTVLYLGHNSGVLEIEMGPAVGRLLLEDGFETGDLSAWPVTHP